MTPEDRVRRAKEAQYILEHDLFRTALQTVRDDCLDRFKQAKPGDVEALSEARVRYAVVEDVLNSIASVMRDGTLANRDIEAKGKSVA